MSATELLVSDSLSLQSDYVTKTCAILAQRRKGKTYTASVIAEEMVKAKLPFVVLDPTGAWWGLRASADGKSEGLPIIILGGQHGDLPLERHAGRLIADLVLDRPGYYVLDLSLLESKAAERDFAATFAERLYRRKMQPGMDFPLHLFVDEADMFVPQERERADTTMLGAFQSIVRRGGLHGLGTTLISQRPALVNKSVLTQLDVLILLRLVAGNDQDYVDKNYVSRAGTPEQRQALMSSMASLGLGEAWVWEPGAEPPLFERVQIRERSTFNSSATPKPGERRIEPTRLAEVDLAEIKEQMAEVIERATADDPTALRRRIAQLERELQQMADAPAAEVVTETVKVPFVPVTAVEEVGYVRTSLDGLRAEVDRILGIASAAFDVLHNYQPTEARPVVQPAPQDAQPRPVVPRSAPQTEDVPSLGKGERKVLSVLGQYPAGRTHTQLALLAGYSAKASTLGVILSGLRRLGLVEPSAPPRLTEAGMAIADPAPLPTGAELLDYWRSHERMGEGERRVLNALVESYPRDLAHDELCSLTGYSSTASTLGVILSKLRKLGLVEKSARRLEPDFAEAVGL